MRKYRLPIDVVDAAAKDEGLFKIDFQENLGMVSYSNGAVRINVYLTTMTVTTSLDHPKMGKGQLFRKNVSLEMLRGIFKNPRLHTGKGYYNKPVNK
jgi:hypothetical protein